MIKGICPECKRFGKIYIHHKDGNHSNDVQDNRTALCPKCHANIHLEMRISAGLNPGTRPRTEKLPIDWKPEPVPMSEIKRQYLKCFPRAVL